MVNKNTCIHITKHTIMLIVDFSLQYFDNLVRYETQVFMEWGSSNCIDSGDAFLPNLCYHVVSIHTTLVFRGRH